MSTEVYKRSLGYPVDEDVVHHEVENGVATGTLQLTSDYEQPGADLIVSGKSDAPATKAELLENEIKAWEAFEALNGGLNEYALAEVVELHAELVVEREAELMALSKEHPIYTGLVADVLRQKLDELHAEGHPVDAEMYVEAHALAEEIVASNPTEDHKGLVAVAETMIAMIQAQYQLQRLSLAA